MMRQYHFCASSCDRNYFLLLAQCWGDFGPYTQDDPNLLGGAPRDPNDLTGGSVLSCFSIVASYQACILNCGTSFWEASSPSRRYSIPV
jgi:hypothetical protein